MPNFFVSSPLRGTECGQCPPNVTWRLVPPASASSRATALEELMPKMQREASAGDVAYGIEPSSIVTLVTVEFLAILMDADPKYWALVAKIVVDLGVDPALIELRGGAALLHAISLPKQVSAPRDPIEQWFAFHGYVPEARAGTATRYRSAINDPGRWPYVQVRHAALLAVKASENLPAEVSHARNDLSPIFVIYNAIFDFSIAWATCSAQKNVYPCLPFYFDMSKNFNVMYPRFVPCEMPVDKVPVVHPGPALYSPVSAPHAANAAFFDINAENNAFLLVRESRHKNPVLECPLDIVTIK